MNSERERFRPFGVVTARGDFERIGIRKRALRCITEERRKDLIEKWVDLLIICSPGTGSDGARPQPTSRGRLAGVPRTNGTTIAPGPQTQLASAAVITLHRHATPPHPTATQLANNNDAILSSSRLQALIDDSIGVPALGPVAPCLPGLAEQGDRRKAHRPAGINA